MAKKSGGPNKSAAIRDYVQANPDAKPKEIVDALSAQGVAVSSAFVSTIKSKMTSGGGGGGRKKKRAKAGRPKGSVTKKRTVEAAPRAARTGGGGGDVSVASLLKAKKLAEELGGVAKAKATLEALEKITQ